MRVAVLLGGWSFERDVSLMTGQGVVKALERLGHTPIPIDPSRHISRFIDQIESAKVDAVFNALHGLGGEDGTIQSILNVCQIPYTHSGVLASALAMDKYKSGYLFEKNGLTIPKTYLHTPAVFQEDPPMEYPFIVKPGHDGSSVGVSMITTLSDWNKAGESWCYGHSVLLQNSIEGREIHVAVLGEHTIGTVELNPTERFYNYTAKYTPGFCTYQVPAPLSSHHEKIVLESALKAHTIIGCTGVSRSDFIFDGTDFYILEINTQPGFTPTSLVPKIAHHAGLSYEDIIAQLLRLARYDCVFAPNNV